MFADGRLFKCSNPRTSSIAGNVARRPKTLTAGALQHPDATPQRMMSFASSHSPAKGTYATYAAITLRFTTKINVKLTPHGARASNPIAQGTVIHAGASHYVY